MMSWGISLPCQVVPAGLRIACTSAYRRYPLLTPSYSTRPARRFPVNPRMTGHGRTQTKIETSGAYSLLPFSTLSRPSGQRVKTETGATRCRELSPPTEIWTALAETKRELTRQIEEQKRCGNSSTIELRKKTSRGAAS